ncbi:MAG: ATP-binding protein [bacterium]|nr:ATP-binding protein [bacterium]
MLLRFEVSNYRSILDPVELSMIAVDQDRAAARGFEQLSERVLTVAGIYGSNASGKSTVLEALAWLSFAVRTSLHNWYDSVPRFPHRFGDGPDRPSTFEVDFLVDGVRHGYRLEVDTWAVLYESLHSYPERRRRTLFEREGDDISFRRGLSRVGGIQELLTPTTLALSAAMRLGDPVIGSAGSALSWMNALGLKAPGGFQFSFPDRDPSTAMFLGEPGHCMTASGADPATRRAFVELLRFADPGIDHIGIVGSDDPENSDLRRELLFVRRHGEDLVAFLLDEESAGTQAWFTLLGPALEALLGGQVLLFNEIDASLHPRLSTRLIELFQDPQTNPRGAQLIFTTHDTSLLGALNRDEVWFTEKAPGRATRLIALAEFGGDRVRRSLNLERAYLQGRFGAIPDVDQADLRNAVGAALEAASALRD